MFFGFMMVVVYLVGSCVSLYLMVKVSKLKSFKSLTFRKQEWYFGAMLSWPGVIVASFILLDHKFKMGLTCSEWEHIKNDM